MWEVAQAPLYSIWTSSTFRDKVFAAIHCVLGDMIIAGSALLGALVLVGSPSCPCERWLPVFAAALAGGIGYTVHSEWLNTTVRQGWAYSPLMPVMPGHAPGDDEDDADQTTSPIERVDLRISTMGSRVSALKEIKPVLATLYCALSDDQKKKADQLLIGMGSMM